MIHNMTDAARAAWASDSINQSQIKLATVQKITNVLLIDVLGRNAAVDGGLQIDLGNGHLLTMFVQEKAK